MGLRLPRCCRALNSLEKLERTICFFERPIQQNRGAWFWTMLQFVHPNFQYCSLEVLTYQLFFSAGVVVFQLVEVDWAPDFALVYLPPLSKKLFGSSILRIRKGRLISQVRRFCIPCSKPCKKLRPFLPSWFLTLISQRILVDLLSFH